MKDLPSPQSTYEQLQLDDSPRRKRVLFAIGSHSHIKRELLQSALQYLQHGKDWNVQVMEPWNLRQETIEAFEPDGIIASIVSEDQKKFLSDLNVPLINSSATVTHSGLPLVRIDDYDLGAMAADFLKQRNPRHFVYCGKAHHHRSPMRESSFKERLEEEGVSKEEITTWDDELNAPFYDLITTLPQPIAIYAQDDQLGQRIVHGLIERGLDVPQHAIVLGTGNDPIYCNSCYPPLSSIALKTGQSGYETAQTLDAWMNGDSPDWSQKLIPPKDVIERGSTSKHSDIDPRLSRAMQYYLDHMERGHNVEEVSRRSELSYRSFHRLFKEQLNIAPKSWMEQEQFKRARRLLETSNLKLSDVAGQCGYSDDKSLIRAFRRLGRETPASYRKAFRTSSAG